MSTRLMPVTMYGVTIDTQDLHNYLKSLGFEFYTGVSTKGNPPKIFLATTAPANSEDEMNLIIAYSDYIASLP